MQKSSKISNSILRLYHILHPIWMKLGTKVHMDVLKVHAEKKIPGFNLTLSFGTLPEAPRLKIANFGDVLVL